MKKLFIILLVLFLGFGFLGKAEAQMMGNFYTEKQLNISGSDWEEILRHTKTEEQEGKEIWEKLQSKNLNCENLSNEDFGKLGEYFMGQITGEAHASMNAMMMQMHGKEGEEQMHILMGKRLSGCGNDFGTSTPYFWSGFMPMMNMMLPDYQSGVWSAPSKNFNNMMNFGFGYPMMGWGFGWFGWIFMILWWAVVILAIVFLIRWIAKLGNKKEGKALEILKERLARGEISKQEYEELKKEIEKN